MASAAPVQKWKPTHELIVRLHIGGMSNLDIAEEVGLTPQRISQIINDPTGRKLIRAATMQMRRLMQGELDDRMIVLADRAEKRLEETIDQDFLPGSKGKHHQDNVALSILKGTGFLSKDLGGEAESRPPLNQKLAERLVGALEKANEAAEARDSKIMDVEVVVEGEEA